MRSVRTRITVLNVVAVSVALVTATVIGVISIATFGHESSEESLRLLCQEGKNNLNDYFDSVEQSAEIVSGLITNDLKNRDLNDLNDHITIADAYFKEAVQHTESVATYYYRFDPEVTNEDGFWYVDEGEGLKSHTVSDLTKSDCPWFYGPKSNGKTNWLLPYTTDNLDSFWVVSYNVPIYKETTFVGVIGIEINYKTLGERIKSINVLETGYAYIIENEKGTIVYHPYLDLLGIPENERPKTPESFAKGIKGEKDKYGGIHIEYSFDDYGHNSSKRVRKHCYVLELSNEDMSVVVCVPLSEVNNLWLSVVLQVVIAALIIIAATITVGILFSRRFTKPLKDLTMAAEEINKGNYTVKLEYKGNDEIGVLTNTVNQLIENLGGYINDLNVLAYADALTSVRNRSAYEIAMRELQKDIEENKNFEFAIALFDCDYLKDVNDLYGHDKGNVYLRNSCHLICRVFEHSAVYRIGGDEFVAILQGEDYKNREKLKKQFQTKSAEICSFAKADYEKVRVSIGIATYDSNVDKTAEDVAVHADHLMYENKRERKKKEKK